MQDQPDGRHDRQSLDERVNGSLDKIASLKEALKHVRGMADEMTLLSDLSREITTLRQLREVQY
jgi:hypothetical protein